MTASPLPLNTETATEFRPAGSIPVANAIKAYYPAPNATTTTSNNGYPTNNFVLCHPVHSSPLPSTSAVWIGTSKTNNRLTLTKSKVTTRPTPTDRVLPD